VSEVAFDVVYAAPEKYAAVPTLIFALKVSESTGAIVHNIALRCQIRIEPQRRRYTHAEERRLLELFGETPRWGDTLKPFLWTHVSHMLPGFRDTAEVPLPVPCSYDLEVTAAKYLHALDDGDIPLLFLFSGTIFSQGDGAPGGVPALRVTQVSWRRDATYRLPVRVWRELMDLYYPNSGWLRLRRETLDDLIQFKAQRALASWDDTLETLLREAAARAT